MLYTYVSNDAAGICSGYGPDCISDMTEPEPSGA